MSNLIITQQLLQSLDACQEAQDYMTEKNLWGQTEDVVLANMAVDGKDTYIAWWENTIKTPLFIQTIGTYTVTGYRVNNPITSEWTNYSTLSDAQNALTQVQKNYVIDQKDRFSVNQDIDNPDGTTTWIPVDPFTFDQEDDYQVFNTFTGQYEYYDNLTDAKAAQKNMEDAVANLVPPMQQQITSNHYPYSSWENV